MRRVLALLAASAMAVAVAACGDDPEPETTPPETEAPELPEEPEPLEPGEPAEPEPEMVDPRPGMAGVRPAAFESAKAIDDGRTVAIRFWAGVAPCDVLDRVDVEEGATEVVVTLQVGHEPGAADVACILIAQRYETRVQLDEPLGDRTIVDGANRSSAQTSVATT